MNKKNLVSVAIILCFILMLGCVFIYAKLPANASSVAPRNKYITSIQIQPGDTLHSIAEKYMTEEYKSEKEFFKEIQNINGFNGDTLFAGAFLLVPYYAD